MEKKIHFKISAKSRIIYSLLMEPFIYSVFLTEKGPLAFSKMLFTNDTAFTYLV